MAELKKYTTNVNGLETVLQLSDADAKTRGLVADKPAAKTAAADPDAAPAQKAAAAPANKSRTAASNK